MTSSAEAHVGQGKKLREFEVIVSDIVPETRDTVTLMFDHEPDIPPYRAGQFMTIDPHQFPAIAGLIGYLEHVKGKRELVRAYSMCSSPHDPFLAITVKEEPFVAGSTAYPPLLSPVLVRGLVPGMRLKVVGFTGPYVLPPQAPLRSDHIVHVCAGSGIVPNYSIIRYCLQVHPELRHTLVYSNKTWDDIIFRRQLDEMAAEFPDRLSVVHALTREPDAESRGPNVRRGRITSDLLRELIPDVSRAEVLACGPGISKYDRAAAASRGEQPPLRFLETALACIAEVGVPPERVHREAYG
jgi:3-ketosteroid 9alpha-monooxygenase subunit B